MGDGLPHKPFVVTKSPINFAWAIEQINEIAANGSELDAILIPDYKKMNYTLACT